MPMVCACFFVAWEISMPMALVSCWNSSAVNTDPLSVRICVGTYACLANIDSRALTTDGASGFRSGTANKQRETTSIAVRICVNPFDAGSGPTMSTSIRSVGPLHGSYIFCNGGRVFDSFVDFDRMQVSQLSEYFLCFFSKTWRVVAFA